MLNSTTAVFLVVYLLTVGTSCRPISRDLDIPAVTEFGENYEYTEWHKENSILSSVSPIVIKPNQVLHIAPEMESKPVVGKRQDTRSNFVCDEPDFPCQEKEGTQQVDGTINGGFPTSVHEKSGQMSFTYGPNIVVVTPKCSKEKSEEAVQMRSENVPSANVDTVVATDKSKRGQISWSETPNVVATEKVQALSTFTCES